MVCFFNHNSTKIFAHVFLVNSFKMCLILRFSNCMCFNGIKKIIKNLSTICKWWIVKLNLTEKGQTMMLKNECFSLSFRNMLFCLDISSFWQNISHSPLLQVWDRQGVDRGHVVSHISHKSHKSHKSHISHISHMSHK